MTVDRSPETSPSRGTRLEEISAENIASQYSESAGLRVSGSSKSAVERRSAITICFDDEDIVALASKHFGDVRMKIRASLVQKLSEILLGEKLPLDIVDSETGVLVAPANRRISKSTISEMADSAENLIIDPGPIRNRIMGIINENKTARERLEAAKRKLITALTSID